MKHTERDANPCDHRCICGWQCIKMKSDHGGPNHLIPHGPKEKDCRLTGQEARQILFAIFQAQGRKDDFHEWAQQYIQAAYS